MAEAIAAAGLVATVVTLVDFGSSILKRLNQYRTASKQLPRDLRALRAQLPVVIDSVERIRDQAIAGQLTNDSIGRLSNLLNETVADVKTLDNIIEDSLPAASSSPLKKIHLALRALRHNDDVRLVLIRLHGHIHTLTLRQSTFGVGVQTASTTTNCVAEPLVSTDQANQETILNATESTTEVKTGRRLGQRQYKLKKVQSKRVKKQVSCLLVNEFSGRLT